ncbi:MAG: M42 family metallopeptidase [Chloroflexi bacterium]|nr:M42 family metallopeptidase [Chloroflexota bacterium]
MPEVERLLGELSNAFGPTGFESAVRAIMRRELDPVCDGLETDGLGSLIGRLRGSSDTPRILMTAHMDEVGLMVRFVTPDGFVRFQPVGGWLDQALINQRWVIRTAQGDVVGVTGIKTVHVMLPEARNAVFKKEAMFIDVGAADKDDAETRLGIRPGDPISPDSAFTPLNGGGLLLGKAWDDRVGLAVMVQVLRALKNRNGADQHPNMVFGAATVQEEVGLRGARTSSHQVDPEIGINLESGVAGDYPGTNADEAQERIGKGPAIFLHDSSMLPNLKLRDLVVQTAFELGIPVQFNVLNGYGEDGAEIQRSRGGVPAINIAVPTRYLHSHNGIISREDFLRTVELVTAVIRRIDSEAVTRIRQFD